MTSAKEILKSKEYWSKRKQRITKFDIEHAKKYRNQTNLQPNL